MQGVFSPAFQSGNLWYCSGIVNAAHYAVIDMADMVEYWA